MFAVEESRWSSLVPDTATTTVIALTRAARMPVLNIRQA
jgi:hypothetical protein